VPPHPLVRGGGNARLRLKGWGSPNSDEGTYTVVLYIYKYFVSYSKIPIVMNESINVHTRVAEGSFLTSIVPPPPPLASNPADRQACKEEYNEVYLQSTNNKANSLSGRLIKRQVESTVCQQEQELYAPHPHHKPEKLKCFNGSPCLEHILTPIKTFSLVSFTNCILCCKLLLYMSNIHASRVALLYVLHLW
jgi:hypothetical protein